MEVDHGGIVRVVPPESVKDAEDVCASLQIRLMTPAGIDFMPLLRIALQFDPGWLSKSDVGWCEIRHVPSGTYQVGIRGQDQGSPLVRDIVVTDGGDATADFR